jgi:hypothetical protein
MDGRRSGTVMTRQFLSELAVFAVALLLLLARVPSMERFMVNADHGYQLAAGAELLHGRLPGVDSLSTYGPLVAVMAAGTLAATGNLVAEAMLCATAWATALWLAFRITRRRFGTFAACCAAIFGYLLLARFHKWYMWLLPLASLAILDPISGTPTRRRWAAGGLVCGLGALLRPEIGLACLAAMAVVALADTLRDRGARWPAGWIPLAVGFSVAPAAWAALVALVAGNDGLARAIRVIPESIFGSTEHLSKGPPPFRPDDPFSKDSAIALGLRLLPAIDGAALVVGGWVGYLERSRVLAREGRLLAAIGLTGLALYPHAAFRADISHLLQGIWPVVLAVPAFCALSLRFARSATADDRGRAAWRGIAAAWALAIASLTVLVPLAAQRHLDLSPVRSSPFSGLAELRAGLGAIPDHPYTEVVASIGRLTKPSDEVLLAVSAPQLLVFANRPTSGLLFVFHRGIFDSPAWRRERLAMLERKPPALIVAPANFADLRPEEGFRASEPDMYEFVRAHYRVVATQRRAGMIMLAPREPMAD